jgi:uncharacterized FlaG/YvyC family protein
MEVNPINAAGSATSVATASGSAQETLQKVVAATRALNASDVDREFSVARDPQTHKFVVLVRDRSTGDVIDQLPPESVLKMTSQLNIQKTTGEQSE